MLSSGNAQSCARLNETDFGSEQNQNARCGFENMDSLPLPLLPLLRFIMRFAFALLAGYNFLQSDLKLASYRAFFILGNIILSLLVGGVIVWGTPFFGFGGEKKWSNFPLFVMAFDFAYYGFHRLCHRFMPRHHFRVHHKKVTSGLQSFEFHPTEFFSMLLFVHFPVMELLPVPDLGMFLFLAFYTGLQFVIHSGSSSQWPILVSPYDHEIHHTLHFYNHSSLTKLPDKVFKTYYYKKDFTPRHLMKQE